MIFAVNILNEKRDIDSIIRIYTFISNAIPNMLVTTITVRTVYLLGIPRQFTILNTKLTSFPTNSSGASTNLSSASVYSFPLALHGATST